MTDLTTYAAAGECAARFAEATNNWQVLVKVFADPAADIFKFAHTRFNDVLFAVVSFHWLLAV